MYINYVTKNIIISTEVCHADNDNDDEYCNYNALLKFLITNTIFLVDTGLIVIKTITIIAEYLKFHI